MQEEIKDQELSKVTKKRTAYKYHVLIYFIMNILFWTMWYISLKNNPSPSGTIDSIPWPVWIMAGWGILVIIHYYSAYKPKRKSSKKKKY